MKRTRRTVGQRLSVVFALLVFLGGAVTLLQARGTGRPVAALQTIDHDRPVPLGELADVSYGLNRTRIVLMDALLDQDGATVKQRIEQADAALDTARRAWKRYLATERTAEEKTLAGELERTMAALELQGFAPMRSALAAGDFGAARENLARRVNPLMVPVSGTLEQLFERRKRAAADASAAAEALTRKLCWIGGLAPLVAAGLGSGFALSLMRGLPRSPAPRPTR